MKEENIQVSINEAYQNAVSLLEKGNFSLAEKQLAEVLIKNPNGMMYFLENLQSRLQVYGFKSR